MEEIFARRPDDQLKNADNEIKTYVLLLERKLKSCISLNNLNKEVENKLLSTQEELSTLKLQNKENGKSEELVKEITKLKAEVTHRDIENNHLKQRIMFLQNESQQLKKNSGFIKTPPAINSKSQILQTSAANSTADAEANANSVLVKGFTEQELNAIPKINIINLCRLMGIKALDNDIVKVSKKERQYYERHNLKPSKVILIVQLRTPELKIEFLKNKEKLKLRSNFEDVDIIDYVSDEVYNLYQYAKILKSSGYAQIYWRNNSVYAKKTRSTLCEPVLITSKSDVDALKVSKT